VKQHKRNRVFVSFSPAVSASAAKSMRQTTRRWNFRNRTDLSLADISQLYNPVLRGWLAYYGRFCPSAMYAVFRHFNKTLVAWAKRKYLRLRRHTGQAARLLIDISRRQPYLFVHWQQRMVGVFF